MFMCVRHAFYQGHLGCATVLGIADHPFSREGDKLVRDFGLDHYVGFPSNVAILWRWLQLAATAMNEPKKTGLIEQLVGFFGFRLVAAEVHISMKAFVSQP